MDSFVKNLVAAGYALTSNRHGMISRIDREDWREYMAKKHCAWDAEGEGMAWVDSLGSRGAADHYRRVYSRDTLEVGAYAKHFPKSAFGPTRFINVGITC